jgi:hypothetical protein
MYSQTFTHRERPTERESESERERERETSERSCECVRHGRILRGPLRQHMSILSHCRTAVGVIMRVIGVIVQHCYLRKIKVNGVIVLYYGC